MIHQRINLSSRFWRCGHPQNPPRAEGAVMESCMTWSHESDARAVYCNDSLFHSIIGKSIKQTDLGHSTRQPLFFPQQQHHTLN